MRDSLNTFWNCFALCELWHDVHNGVGTGKM